MIVPKTAQGVAQVASEEDIRKDEQGFTYPNLHRRVEPSRGEGEVADRKYTIGVYDGLHSTVTVEKFTHDEESTTCEIP